MRMYYIDSKTGKEVDVELQDVNIEVEQPDEIEYFGYYVNHEIDMEIIIRQDNLISYFRYQNDYLVRKLMGG